MKLALQCALCCILLSLANSLQCYHFKGAPDQALQKQEAKNCEGNNPFCSSSVVIYNGLLRGKVVVKGCSQGDSCNKTQTTSMKAIETNQTMLCCGTDLCNRDMLPDDNEESAKWGGECLACNGPPLACGGDDLPSLQCDSSGDSCIQVSITTALNQEVHQNIIKSCSNASTCPGLAAFSNGDDAVSYAANHQCCNGTHCNAGYFTETDPGAENGLECHCRASSNRVDRMKCRGEMTRCVDLIGSSPLDIVMSGCATEAFCQGLYPKFSIPGWLNTTCCSTSLCNHGNDTIPYAS
ncbi:urokinase plasminogen activator surface receptor-like [Spea bombifrons]|uniref:urokinase plasminogen activator surface receptor-like n=1 Tax=Spea bombifrons TaxID=233779 RepID=UPI00234B32B6|nr:urokinase plasminogen activator surface receptor-like [Spea bombifrons]